MNNIIYIKNMVCPRCIASVSSILDSLKIPYNVVALGQVDLKKELTNTHKNILSKALNIVGFGLINDRKSQLIEQMKNLVIEKIHHSNDELDFKWPNFISNKLNLDYKYLSSLFSSVESITFEQYIINQKIERIKELIVYDELTLSEISHTLNYSSVAYLSNQFKKITGMTPTQFKKAADKNRKSLDEI